MKIQSLTSQVNTAKNDDKGHVQLAALVGVGVGALVGGVTTKNLGVAAVSAGVGGAIGALVDDLFEK